MNIAGEQWPGSHVVELCDGDVHEGGQDGRKGDSFEMKLVLKYHSKRGTELVVPSVIGFRVVDKEKHWSVPRSLIIPFSTR